MREYLETGNAAWDDWTTVAAIAAGGVFSKAAGLWDVRDTWTAGAAWTAAASAASTGAAWDAQEAKLEKMAFELLGISPQL